MSRSKGQAADPRLLLVRLLLRLADRHPFVTLADLERVAARPSSRLPIDGLAELVEVAVNDSLILKDLRTFYDRASGSYWQDWVYRVNVRHPHAARLLDE
jgi:hypothetical protein